MPITVTYGAFTGATNDAADLGLKAYFNTVYNANFDPSNHGTGYQGFSEVDNTPVTVGTETYYMGDLQYAARSTIGTAGVGGTALAFIAEAKTVANGGTFGQLVYTNTDSPTHTLFGDLDVIKLGTGINPDASISAAPGTSYALSTTQVTFSNLTSVLNEGINSSGAVIDWDTGNNDVHNVIYPLIGGAAGSTATETSGLEVYLNSAGINYEGTANNEVFDGFNSADLFKVGGGADKILGFVAADDTVNLGGMYGYSTATDAYNAITNQTLTVNGTSYTGAYLESVDESHSVFIAGVLKSGLSAADFLLV